MMDGVHEIGSEVGQIRDQLQQARDELRPKLHLASADTLGVIETIEREIEHLGSAFDEASRPALLAAVARLRHVTAALGRAPSPTRG